jgi:sulfite reductase beta subunit-like hemoprotein
MADGRGLISAEQPGSARAFATPALPRPIVEELEEFQRKIGDYLEGTLGPDDFKKCRLQLGIYGIRGRANKQMVRVKVPSGRLNAEQADRLACVVEEFATGRCHLTTRQDVQMYEVPIERTPELLRLLAEVELTSREACGNSVRNVTACPLTGLCPDELFDVTPYSLAVTRHFLRNPVSQYLPRKFKISFSGCRRDCAMAPIHDIGAVAVTHGEHGRTACGFRLYVGGGLGAFPMAAQPLEPFTSIDHLLPTFEAIIRVFDQHGERKNRQRARLKFLIERIGFEKFRALVFGMREALVQQRQPFPPLPAPEAVTLIALDHPVLPDTGEALYRRWLKTNVQLQRQPGHAVATVRLVLGDCSAEQMRALAELSRRYAQRQLIITQGQNLCLPWVRFGDLPALYADLVRINLALPEAHRIQDITACPGADSCQIGITSSRGLAAALTELLEQPQYKTDDLKDLRINISGCPNSCGQHHIADLGFFGASRAVAGRAVPHYQLLVGGGFGDGRVRFGQPVAKLPSKHVPQALERLLQCYRRERTDHEPFGAFVQRVGVEALRRLLHGFTVVGSYAEEPDAYRDWGKPGDFSLSGMGQGECAG